MPKYPCFKSKKTYYLNRLLILSVALLGLTNQVKAVSFDNSQTVPAMVSKANEPLSTAIDCSNTTTALFSQTTGIVCFPVVEVSGATALQFFKAQIKLMSNDVPLNFTLLSADTIPAAGSNNPGFALPTGILTVPLVESHKTYGTERYQATLQLIPNSNPAQFSIVTIDAIISPDYQPGITWKPYVGLLSNEKEAFDLLAKSEIFSDVADAVYDFGTRSVGNWDLIQEKNTDAGMQAGVYRNRVSNELAIAFRGSEEICLLPILCSFKEIEESGNDLKTDAYLTQGQDSGQFNDAFNFTSEVLKANPNTKITLTGHSLGGGLAQAAGASFLLEAFAFNSSPVPNNFWNDHNLNQFDSHYATLIHVLSDIHDPVSNTNSLGAVYADAEHVTPNRQFDFDKKEILPTYKTDLDTLRFSRHSMTKLRENIIAVTDIYRLGW